MSIENLSTSKLIYVRSNDRLPTAAASTTSFRVELGNAANIHRSVRIVLRSAHFVNSQFNIRTGVNDTLYWTHNAIDYSTMISGGFYDTAAVIVAVKAAMDAAMSGVPATVAITQDPLTDLMSISWSVSSGFVRTAEALAQNMAFNIGFTSDRAAAEPYLSDTTPSLQGLTHCFLRSRELAPANQISSASLIDNVLINIPITAPYRGVNHYEPADDELASINYKTPTDITSVDIELRDEFDRVLDLRGQPTEFVFKVYF
jgi:hypothetical protein